MQLRKIISLSLFILLGVLSVSCQKKKTQRQSFVAGYGFCSNDKLGSFDISLTAGTGEQGGLFELGIVTVQAAAYGGQYVRAALANQSLQYEELVQASLIKDNKVLFQGWVTAEQLDAYPMIVIAPYRGGGNFLESESNDDEAICQVPSRDPEATGSSTTN